MTAQDFIKQFVNTSKLRNKNIAKTHIDRAMKRCN